MFLIEIEVIQATNQENITGFSQGHLSMWNEQDRITSRDPFRSMMIFISLSEFLAGVIMLENNKTMTYSFLGADCSFSFDVTKAGSNFYVISNKKHSLGRIDKDEFLAALWSELKNLVDSCRDRFDWSGKEAVAFLDLRDSLREYCLAFGFEVILL